MEMLTDSVEIDVSSGEVSLDLPKNADFKLNGNVSSGDITNTFSLNNLKETNSHIQGTYGSGKHAVDLNVSSGEIHIH